MINTYIFNVCILGLVMSLDNRYKFCKELYSNYIIYIKRKNRLNTYFIDNKICMMLDIRSYYYLEKYSINYLVLNNLEIIKKREYKNNNYNKYLVIYLINEIGNCLREKAMI